MRGGSVAVVGGSVGGCAAALAAVRGGAEKVTVLERAGGELRGRGVGVSLHNDRYAELEEAGYVHPDMPWGRLDAREWTVRDGDADLGRTLAVHPLTFRAYAWGSLWSELRRRVPEEVDYRTGTTVSAVDADADGVTLRLADGAEERYDAVIGADGYRSVVRNTLFPGLQPTYAGYLGWRGAALGCPAREEGEAAADIAWTTLRTVVFPGGHCIIYRIPDPDTGGFRVNWVFYTVPPDHLDIRLDPRTPTSLPPGRLTAELSDHVREVVAAHFPPYWAECVLRTPREQSFIQPIYDLQVPHYATGRVLLVGDAATVARPHTGGGALKAIQDALVLEKSWRAGGTWEEVTSAYDRDRTADGATMVGLGRRLGRSQVLETPDWASMDASELTAWWLEQHRGSEQSSGFGGVALGRS